MSCFTGCFEGFSAFWAPPETEEEQDEYSALVGFLSEVPLFKKQLSKIDLPNIAQAMHRREWRPGDAVVKQGQACDCFYLVKSGKALVIRQEAGTVKQSPKQHLCTELVRGDFFGARSLVVHIPMVATVCAAGPENLMTLSLSRKEFEQLGLHRKMVFARRPAIDGIDDRANVDLDGKTPKNAVAPPDLEDEEVAFVQKAINANANLRALLAEAKGKAQDVAKLARRRELPKGTQVLQAGYIAKEFIVVAEGSLEASEEVDSLARNTSAEKEVQKRVRMAERLQRKAEFFRKLGTKRALRRQSMVMSPRPRPTEEKKMQRCGSDNSLHGRRFEVGDCVGLKDPSSVKRPFPSPTMSPRTPKSPWGSGTPLVAVEDKPRPRLTFTVTTPREAANDPLLLKMPPLLPITRSNKSLSSCTTVASLPSFDIFTHHWDAAEADSIGVVTDVSLGQVTVWFPRGKTTVAPRDLTLREGIQDNLRGRASMNRLVPGESLGELSLLYNSHARQTWVAAEESVIYVVQRKHFKACFNQSASAPNKEKDVKQFTMLLDEVHMLSPLLHVEREELARNATGRVKFMPGERVIAQGATRGEYPQWYIVEKGEAIISREFDDGCGNLISEELSRQQRGGHFGERSLLRGEDATEISVHAGPWGLTCLAIDGEILLSLNLGNIGEGGLVDYRASTADYERSKAKCGGYRRDSIDFAGQEIDMERLVTVKFLGLGGFGAVTLVRDPLIRNHLYALKKMSKGRIVGTGMQRRVAAEREIMSLVDSRFCIRFYRSFKDDQNVYFLMEAGLGGDLLKVRRKHPEIFERDHPQGYTTAFFVACITLALEHLHENKIIYRDLKPENVLLDSRGYAKLCDFGFARLCLRKSYTFLGTPEYMAPEMIDLPHRHDHMVDWWALGVMAFELLAGRTPYCVVDEFDEQEDQQEQVLAIRKLHDQGVPEHLLPRTTSLLAKDFIRRLLRLQPSARLGARRGAKEVIQHDWFRVVKLDIIALREQQLPSPFQPQIVDPEACTTQPEELAEEQEGMEALFLPYADNQSGWDAPF